MIINPISSGTRRVSCKSNRKASRSTQEFEPQISASRQWSPKSGNWRESVCIFASITIATMALKEDDPCGPFLHSHSHSPTHPF
ncbi:hypothetical protein B0H12DRAFT_1138489 [Mycena haematopus]|nr:hypothetical protein B0H12DRAFT_1138489 [Mycena haematopus]